MRPCFLSRRIASREAIRKTQGRNTSGSREPDQLAADHDKHVLENVFGQMAVGDKSDQITVKAAAGSRPARAAPRGRPTGRAGPDRLLFVRQPSCLL